MRIILKHTLKNIFRKPFRLMLMVFCLFCCAFVALMSLDMSGAIDSMLREFLGSNAGNMDVLVAGSNISDELLNDEHFPANKHMAFYEFDNSFYIDLKDQYTYVKKKNISIMAFDSDLGREMNVVRFDGDIPDGEVVISKELADYYEVKEGDTIALYDEMNNYHDFKIYQVIDYADSSLFAGYSAILNLNTMPELTPDMKIEEAIFDVEDDARSKEIVDYCKENYPNLTVISIFDSDSIVRVKDIITKLMFAMLAVCILMVIFVAISVSERIISERMSVVGTLRSVGVSSLTTTVILLLENIFYAVVGSVLGCLAYRAVRSALLKVLLSDQSDGKFGDISPSLYALVIVLSILVLCLCPLKEVIKAANTPIRDLIFSNKDTEYRFSKFGTAMGILCAIAAGVITFLPKAFYLSFAQVGLIVFALALLFPYIQYAVGKVLSKLFEKLGFPIARLAATEVYTKKSTVGSSVLIATALALVLVVNLVGTALKGVVISDNFSSTNYVTTMGNKEESFYRCIENVEGVTDVEYIYFGNDSMFKINGKENKSTRVIGVPEGGLKYYVISSGAVPLEENEISLGEQVAKDNGIKVGDTIEIEFNSESYYPITKTFTVKTLCDFSSRDISGLDILVNEKIVKEISDEYPDSINIVADDPKMVDEFIEDNLGDIIDKCYTLDEYHEEAKKAAFGFDGVIRGIMIFGMVIAFIGSVSSLLIGFEGRKRECAVLCSTSMPRKRLNRMLFLESFFSSGIAVLTAIPAGILMMFPVKVAFTFMSMQLKILTGFSSFVYIILIMWAVFTLTSLFPIRALKKMKLAEQLKYE